MSIGLGMTIAVIAVVMMVVFFGVYLWADYTERKNHNAFVRRNARYRNREILRAEKEVKNTIWEATEFTINRIKRELW